MVNVTIYSTHGSYGIGGFNSCWVKSRCFRSSSWVSNPVSLILIMPHWQTEHVLFFGLLIMICYFHVGGWHAILIYFDLLAPLVHVLKYACWLAQAMTSLAPVLLLAFGPAEGLGVCGATSDSNGQWRFKKKTTRESGWIRLGGRTCFLHIGFHWKESSQIFIRPFGWYGLPLSLRTWAATMNDQILVPSARLPVLWMATWWLKRWWLFVGMPFGNVPYPIAMEHHHSW